MKSIFRWDSCSDQPHIITDKAFKKQQKQKYRLEYLAMFLKFLAVFPVAFIGQFLMRFPKVKTQIGLGVNLDKGETQYELVEELGVQNLIIRLPLWELDRIDEYVNFIKGFKGKNILINILQDREHIENSDLLAGNIRLIFNKLDGLINQYQIGNATNRTKWGFFAPSEYLDFYQVVQTIRDNEFPRLKLIGSGVIDFEYYYTTSHLFNFKKVKFDVLSTLLYVDRRGAPQNRQYGFNLKNKINLLAAMVGLSNKSHNEIVITEANWPLKGTAPYAPTSEKECVSEADYAQYMQDYFDIARKTKQVKIVYWHQLIAPGYGLVDNREGGIRKTPAFYQFKEIIDAQNSD